MGSIPIRPAGMVFGVRSETRNHMHIGAYMVLGLVLVLVLVLGLGLGRVMTRVWRRCRCRCRWPYIGHWMRVA